MTHQFGHTNVPLIFYKGENVTCENFEQIFSFCVRHEIKTTFRCDVNVDVVDFQERHGAAETTQHLLLERRVDANVVIVGRRVVDASLFVEQPRDLF